MPHAETRLLTVAEVCRRVGLARPTIYRMVAAERFPRPIHVASRAPRWRSDEISEWIEARTSERDATAA